MLFGAALPLRLGKANKPHFHSGSQGGSGNSIRKHFSDHEDLDRSHKTIAMVCHSASTSCPFVSMLAMPSIMGRVSMASAARGAI
jgi:hypothetical protein